MEVIGTAQTRRWTEVLEGAAKSDWYHLPHYHRMAEQAGEGQGALFVYQEGKDFMALPLLLRPLSAAEGLEDSAWMDASSVYGYAGPIASNATMSQSIRANFHLALRIELQGRKVISVFSRLHPFLHQTQLLEGIGECVPIQETVSIDLMLEPGAQKAQFRKEYVSAIAKAKAQGLTCEEVGLDQGLEEFMEIYRLTMQRKNASAHFHFERSYFEDLQKALGSALHLFVVRFEGKTVSAALFTRWDGIVQYHLSGTLSEYLKFAPAKLLLDTVRLWATQKGSQILHLGGGTAPGPDNSLFRFKAGFSQKRHMFSVWRWVVQPDAYAEACRLRARWNLQHGFQPMQPHFFPQYRSAGCAMEETR